MVRKDENTDDTPHVWTRANLFRGLNESLQRMKPDYIDSMQLHNPPVDVTENKHLVDALREMQQGKVRFIGISTTLPHLPAYLEWGVFDTFQIPYSTLEREHEGWISRTAAAGIGTIIRGGVTLGEVGVGLGNEDRCRKTGASSGGCLRGGKTSAGSCRCCSRSNRLIPSWPLPF